MITSQKARRPDFKGRALEAIKVLEQAEAIALRDHRREQGIVFFDVSNMQTLIVDALNVLQGRLR